MAFAAARAAAGFGARIDGGCRADSGHAPTFFGVINRSLEIYVQSFEKPSFPWIDVRVSNRKPPFWEAKFPVKHFVKFQKEKPQCDHGFSTGLCTRHFQVYRKS